MNAHIVCEFNMQKIRVTQLFILLLALSSSVSSFSVWAAPTPKDAVPLEEVPPPPKITDGEPLDEPQVTIRKKGKETIEEYRINGELYMMKITPDHGVPYYLHKEDQDGGWVNVGPNPPLSIPKWVIFRF